MTKDVFNEPINFERITSFRRHINTVGIKSLWAKIFQLKIKNKEYNTVSTHFHCY